MSFPGGPEVQPHQVTNYMAGLSADAHPDPSCPHTYLRAHQQDSLA